MSDHSHTHRRRGPLSGLFSHHSHDHADTADRALETSTEGVRALKLSLLILAVTAGLQLVVVFMTSSVGLLADTIHNFGDALTAFPLAVAFWVGRRRPTNRYSYGYGRAEDLAGVFIVAVIAASAVIAGWESVRRLLHPQDVDNLAAVAVAGVVGFAGNEWVALYRIRVGRRIGSAALVADGLHARSDGLTSLAVVGGAAGVALGWRAADAVVGLVITAAILVILWTAGRDIYRRLMDSVDPELTDQVRAVVAGVPGVEDVDAVRIRWIGHRLHAEVEIVSDRDLTLADAHEIGEEAHHRLLHEIPRLAQATIHTSPCSHDGVDHHARSAHHRSRDGVSPVSPSRATGSRRRQERQ